MFIKKPFIICLFLFVLLQFKNTIFSFPILFCFIFYQIKYKYNIVSIFLVCFIFFYSTFNFSIFNNIVLETNQNYVIASINHEKVLIYSDEIYFFGEEVIIQSSKKEIETLSNFNIFNFRKYMNQMNINYYYDDCIFIKKNSIQRKMYEYINTMNEDIKTMIYRILYQFDANQNIIYSSGMQFSYINQLMIQFFHQFFSYSLSYFFSSLFICIFGFLFPFKFPIFRIFSGNIVKIFLKEKSKKDKIGYQYLICLLLFPNSVYSLSFSIPFLLQISNIFIQDKSIKRLTSKLILIFIQFYQTCSCQIIPIFFFRIFQKMNAIFLILTLIQIMIPIPFINRFESILLFIESNILSIHLHGHVHYLLFIGFIYHFFQMIYNHKKLILPLICILLFIPLQAYLNPFYKITFINVGQGDSILIQAPFNLNNTLIDIPKNKEQIVIDYLHSIGVNKIDTLLLTHSDSDHNGGKDAFINNFQVETIIEKTDKIEIYNQELFNVNHTESTEDNDKSIVLFGNVGNMNVCLMGDASIKVEKEIIQHYEFNCDILKVGHHGSKTSSDPLFIQNVKPKIAIISAQKNNYYGHPHASVINTLNKFQIKTYQTQYGAIQIKSFLKLKIIKTSDGEFDIMIL